jgi:hypothetical protein
MEADDDLMTWIIATHTTNNGATQKDTSQEPSRSSPWTMFTAQKQQAATKKYKMTPILDVDKLHYQKMRDPAYCKLCEKGMDELKTVFTQVATADDEWLTHATATIDGGIDPRGAKHKAPHDNTTLKKGTSRLEYAHELRWG